MAIMTAEFMYTLENGREISESEILQPFMIYRRIKKHNQNYYVLMPKLNQSGLKDCFILTDENGIRIYDKNNDCKLHYRITQLIDKENNTLRLVERLVCERAVIERVCKELIHNIKYLNNENNQNMAGNDSSAIVQHHSKRPRFLGERNLL